MNQAAALARLESLLNNPTSRTPQEGAPIIALKNGKRLMVERVLGGRFIVSLHYGCTCREVGRARGLEGLLALVLEQA